MAREQPRPVTRESADLGNGLCLAAVLPDQYTISPVIATLRQRFGLSDHLAALIAGLAGIGPQEVR